jgi:hypothetical protein
MSTYVIFIRQNKMSIDDRDFGRLESKVDLMLDQQNRLNDLVERHVESDADQFSELKSDVSKINAKIWAFSTFVGFLFASAQFALAMQARSKEWEYLYAVRGINESKNNPKYNTIHIHRLKDKVG